jgi:metallo-beta-lactamase family protein
MRLSFLGGATTVTGSQYLLDTGDARVLIDCGMFQGSPNETVRNRLPFAYDPKDLDAVLLTHAHLDHCGLIPHLVASGFGGAVHMTSGTAELAGLVLLDAAKLQTEFAKRAARRARHHHHLPHDAEADLRSARPEVSTEVDEPLYTEADALASMRRFKTTSYGAEFAVANGVTARFVDAGHVLVESTYGGREHEPEAQSVAVLAEAVNAVHDAGGVLLVPSFAVGRTQDMVWELDRLLTERRIPRLPLYLDSPMASKATEIYRRHAEYFDDEMRALLARQGSPLDYPGAVVTNDVAASRAIKDAPRPYMIVASNGMLTGGRVLSHLRDLIDDPNATLLFVGYQGEGTLGSHLQRGVKQVTIDGELRDVRCRIRSLDGFSAHADEPQLLDWMGAFAKGKRLGDAGFPKTVFVVHGDPEAEHALEPKLAQLGFRTKIPSWRETVTLD